MPPASCEAAIFGVSAEALMAAMTPPVAIAPTSAAAAPTFETFVQSIAAAPLMSALTIAPAAICGDGSVLPARSPPSVVTFEAAALAGEENQDIQDAYAGEIEAFVGDFERIKQEAVTAATAAETGNGSRR